MLYRALIAAALLTTQFANESLAQAPALVLPLSTAQQAHATPIQPDSTYALSRATKLTIFVANSPATIKARKLLIIGSPTTAKMAEMPRSSYPELTANISVPAPNEGQAQSQLAPVEPPPGGSTTPSSYLLGPGDQLSIFVADLPDEFADKTFRIDSTGDLSLPVAGHVHAAGLTTSALESEIKAHLTVMKNPQVSVSLAAFGSQAVSVLGAVNSPGIRQLEGHKTLFEILSASGGLRPDAGYLVNVTRDLKWGRIPLANAFIDPSGTCSVASIHLKDIINATNPAENIAILPGDTISVPKADLVYAVGSVTKPGGFPLNEHESLSALQVVSLAEGITKTAASDKAKILRAVPQSHERIEIPVNIKELMAGKGADVRLQPDDILFIPNSGAKSVGYRAVESLIAAGTGIAIYGRF